MKFAVLGAGLQGSACVYDLLQNKRITEIAVADSDKHRAQMVVDSLGKYASPHTQLVAYQVDVSDVEPLTDFLKLYDVVISAVPYFLNLRVTQAAIAAKTHMVDMGGNTDLVFEQRQYSDQAAAQDVTILPDCGLAPGMANIIAAHGIAQFDSLQSVQIRVGGLPQFPRPPLNYQLFFSIHGLINEYMGQSVVLRDGEIAHLPTLTELETLDWPEPVGHQGVRELEAFHTLGGLSTLPWTFRGKVRHMDYKTIRYPGHCHQIKTMADLGLLDEEPVQVGGHWIKPRDAFAASVIPRLTLADREDVVLVRVTLTGEKSGRQATLAYTLTDRYDPETGFTAMMRCTAFPVAIVAQMMGEGVIQQRGVLPLETAVPTDAFLHALAERGLHVQEQIAVG